MNFDFNNTVIEESGSKYFQPGNYLVKTTKVEAGMSSQKQTPYVRISVADKSGMTCEQDYYLSTTVKEGSNKSAFDISSQAILRILAAANNLDINTEEGKNKTKSYLNGVTTTETLATKLSSLLVGKEFAIHLSGKWVNPSDSSKKSWVKAEFGSGNFAVPSSKLSTLNPNPKVKGEALNNGTSTVTTGITSTEASW